jgi:hypothetical protein
MDYIISKATELKLRDKHFVFKYEILECFQNRTQKTITDDREEHRAHPPTEWFIAETDAGRRLKVVFIQLSKTEIVIRTAYRPDEVEEEIYDQKT